MEPFEPDTLASPEQRIRDLEKALPTSGFYRISQILSPSAFASENSWNAALGLRQKLFQGGSVWASIAAARHALKTRTCDREDKRSDVVLQVRAGLSQCSSGRPRRADRPPGAGTGGDASRARPPAAGRPGRPPSSSGSRRRWSGTTRSRSSGGLSPSRSWPI